MELLFFINSSIGFISYAISTLLYLVILIISFFSLHKQKQGKLFLLLITATLIWSGTLTLSQMGSSIAFEMVFIAELLRYFTWFYTLQHVSGQYQQKPFKLCINNPLAPIVIILIFVIAVAFLILNDYLNNLLQFQTPNIILIGWLMIFSILGLILVEHLYRNTSSDSHDKISFFAISAGAIFCFDFFVFADALLVQKIDYEYWSARGIVNVLIIPTLILAAVRNPNLAPGLHISREFVFHSATLIGSGLYLIIMSFAGYIIKQESGEWGEFLQITFLFTSIVLLIALMFSSSLKIKFNRYMNRTFRNKYDYRTEWKRFSDTLLTLNADESIYQRSLKSAGQIVESKGASLWIFENNQYHCASVWKMKANGYPTLPKNSSLIKFIRQKKSLFTLNNYINDSQEPETYDWFNSKLKSWLILPLWVNDELFGFIHLKESDTQIDLDIEDQELLDIIAYQIALSLSLNKSTSELQQAERFKQVNQMTAFLVHDLKTLLSQLLLLVDNGKIHKNNPAFIEDMLNTLEHVTYKMQRLILQLKEPKKKSNISAFDITEIIKSIVGEYQHFAVQPKLNKKLSRNIFVNGNREELTSSIKHIIQNALESTDKNGVVLIDLGILADKNIEIKIKDNGKGMSAEFITQHLFKPFDSTKGVSGMGIGVYQSREYIRSVSGDIQVTSIENSGTTFTITLPIYENIL